ncbi:DsbA family protein [Thalassospira alkalitolerans]|uniref:DsbA family protein n=1 Tax=Thalassospira alkalitolerans TaxID=1293890 RepID=UPI003AA7DD1B
MQLTYLYDPLCGWCYGATPTIAKLATRPDVTLELMPTGLFSGAGARRMDANFASFAWQNDQRIAKLTGQVFSKSYRNNVLNKPNGSFDSGPAGLAITAVQMTAPKQGFATLKSLQSARYVDGLDNSDTNVVIDILRDLDLDEAAKLYADPTDELISTYQNAIRQGQRLMQRFGLNGVPSLLIKTGRGDEPIASNLLYGDVNLLTTELNAVSA